MTDRTYRARHRGLPLVDFGNDAFGVFAFGNMATGVFAFGNVARGVVAVGNLAMGVVAVGNVGFGILGGAGATIGVGLFAAAGCIALPVVDGVAGIVALNEAVPLLSLVPVVLWAVAYAALRPMQSVAREIEPAPTARVTDVLDGTLAQAWVRVRAMDLRGETLVFRQHGSTHEIRVEHGFGNLVADAGAPVEGIGTACDVDLELVAQIESTGSAGGYRDPASFRRTLEVRGVREVPMPARPWRSDEDFKAFWAKLWLIGAVTGSLFAVASMVR